MIWSPCDNCSGIKGLKNPIRYQSVGREVGAVLFRDVFVRAANGFTHQK
jgi:hypothetical protein